MRIAIPVIDETRENPRVNPHFGHARVFVVYDTDTEKTETLYHDKQEEGTCSPARFLAENRVDIVYTLGMGPRAVALLESRGIRVVTGPYTTLREVIQNHEKLEDYSEYCKKHGTCH